MAVFTAGYFSAQTFTDDFEGYSLDYLGPQSTRWTTWSGTEGGAEDVQVTNNNASSGSKSIYLSSTTSAGGPQDVVLPFDQVYNSGNFTFEANFFVEAGKGAYFNLQGTLVVAQIWALDCFMLQDGTLKLSNQGTPYINANYPPAQWFNLRIEMDLTSNVWELFVNNVSQGSFSNPTGQIGILDLYPVNSTSEGGNNLSGFYVDDIVYNHIPATLPQVNGGITFVNQLGGLAGLNSDVVATVRNLGSNPITSFDISYNYGGGATVTESVSGQNLASLASMDYTFTNPVSVLAGNNTLTVTISNVNGAGQDGNAGDDSKSITTDPIVPAEGKIVVGEEGTGTWCQWCPRGAVYMDLYEETYGPYWAGIAVHNGDPMTVTDYDAAIGPLLGGYPNALVDRGVAVDPSAMNAQFLDRLQTPPVGVLTNTAVWEPSTRTLTVSVKTDFMSAANNNYKLACVLTEDGVTGGAGYAQSNAYAGGANGVMGGYETLPNPVPAAQMVYDHVARVISPSFDGATVFPAVVNANDSHTEVFTFTLPANWNVGNMHIISMLIAPDGSIDNAGKATISEAASVTEAVKDNFLSVYPNPTNKELNITYTNGKVDQINILTLDGKTVISKKITTNYLTTDVSSLKAGMYIVEVISQNNSTKEVFIKQ